jgi:hypothetical protein
VSAFYLCTAVKKLTLKPGKLLQQTDPAYAILSNLGALLWPSTDPFVAAAAILALNAHKGWAANDEDLAQIMLSGVMQSLQAGGGGAGAVPTSTGGTVLTGGLYLADTTNNAVPWTLPSTGIGDGSTATFQQAVGANYNVVISVAGGAALIGDPNLGAPASSFTLQGNPGMQPSGLYSRVSFTWVASMGKYL